ncbi:major facilitator superfamily domain-containing protein [Leucosporidium creatinivorum]|uniref:Major facilitator superfamily domain-containing protein n=1 Tax=Leucosporidium creatinivorum TaxID=106004 RepID=A0A1Y2C0Y5_9BASI|nr:major facilitator superfamily domain-containing protein [Leucosporidium creatinivorum]
MADQAPVDAVVEEKAIAQPIQRFNWGFVPIPKHCRYDPEGPPFKFTMFLNIWFGLSATLTVANIYYSQPILIELSEHFGVSYAEVTRVPTLTQAGYLTSLVLCVPLIDLVPRRPLILLLLFGGGAFSLGLALTNDYHTFLGLSYVTGLCTVIPQILNPLTADLAPPHRRAAAVSIVVSGLVTGMMFGRLMAGILTRFTGSTSHVFFLASGVQYSVLLGMWWLLPDYPKKETSMHYGQLLWSMAKLMVTQPVLLQAFFIGICSCSIFVSWWTTLTFLLAGDPFNYNTFIIGLFAVCGVGSIIAAPLAGKLNDRILPWLGTLLGLLLGLCTACLALGAAKLSLGVVIIVCIFTDIAQQSQQIGNQARIFALDPTARGRINGCYTAGVFLGQVMGSSAGTKVYLNYGWRAAYGLSVAWSCTAILILLARGPHAKGWVGWGGNYSLRKPPPKELGDETAVEPSLEKDKEEAKAVV